MSYSQACHTVYASQLRPCHGLRDLSCPLQCLSAALVTKCMAKLNLHAMQWSPEKQDDGRSFSCGTAVPVLLHILSQAVKTREGLCRVSCAYNHDCVWYALA